MDSRRIRDLYQLFAEPGGTILGKSLGLEAADMTINESLVMRIDRRLEDLEAAGDLADPAGRDRRQRKLDPGGVGLSQDVAWRHDLQHADDMRVIRLGTVVAHEDQNIGCRRHRVGAVGGCAGLSGEV